MNLERLLRGAKRNLGVGQLAVATSLILLSCSSENNKNSSQNNQAIKNESKDYFDVSKKINNSYLLEIRDDKDILIGVDTLYQPISLYERGAFYIRPNNKSEKGIYILKEKFDVGGNKMIYAKRKRK